MPQNVRNIFDETGEWALSSFDHRHQFIASGVYQLPFFSGAGGVDGGACSAAGAPTRSSSRRSGAPFTVNLERRSRQHRRRPGAASRPAARSESARRRADARALVRHVGLRAAGAVHVRQRAAQQRHRTGLRERRFRAGQDLDAAAAPRSSSSGGRSSTCSTARTSICRTGSSATRTSAGSSARRTRARCSSACASRSEVACIG